MERGDRELSSTTLPACESRPFYVLPETTRGALQPSKPAHGNANTIPWAAAGIKAGRGWEIP